MKQIEDFIPQTATVSETVQLIQREGIAIIPDYLSNHQIQNLNVEFDNLLNADLKPVGVKSMPYSKGKGARVTLKNADTGLFPGMTGTFQSEFMNQVMKGYRDNNCILNKEVYVVSDVVGSAHHANDMHFDVNPALKFFIYLSHTRLENGAFTIVPGSKEKTQKIRAKLGNKISYKNRHFSRELDFSEDDVLPIEGTAGTLIVFDTEVWHRAGIVKTGERRVMRGHCCDDSSFNYKLKTKLIEFSEEVKRKFA